jgi:hypothetical protein
MTQALAPGADPLCDVSQCVRRAWYLERSENILGSCHNILEHRKVSRNVVFGEIFQPPLLGPRGNEPRQEDEETHSLTRVKRLIVDNTRSVL